MWGRGHPEGDCDTAKQADIGVWRDSSDSSCRIEIRNREVGGSLSRMGSSVAVSTSHPAITHYAEVFSRVR
ncbi:hypothetical protein H7H82_13865 [Mycobacterium heidelbergense]|uniref:hypothetical protein n=1 Tax=Mycobacterium heidelbergense TaxID=53376 RepID=UPI00114F7235|nr:hypothetical protein [Mycobacterium heidelbergense]MCV7051667.1 hypothetical protein [Mycobacterium heidelbergense]